MPVFPPRVCLLQQRCPVENLREGIECAVTHHRKLPKETICRRVEVKLATMRHYWATSQGREIPAKTLAKLVAVTGRVDLLSLWLAEYGLDKSLMVVERAESANDVPQVIDAYLEASAGHGEMGATLQEALKDRHIDRDEAAKNRLVALRQEARYRRMANAFEAIEARAERFPKAVGS